VDPRRGRRGVPGRWVQRCWTQHAELRIRNLLKALPLEERRDCLTGLRSIYRAPTREAAVRAYWAWARRWRDRYPRLVRSRRSMTFSRRSRMSDFEATYDQRPQAAGKAA